MAWTGRSLPDRSRCQAISGSDVLTFDVVDVVDIAVIPFRFS
jgi:hypothetical protein